MEENVMKAGILMFIIGCLLIKIYKLEKKNQINYSNYQNCLRALSEYDRELANYLRSRDNK